MPQSRDTDESRSDADRSLLVDLLYGELADPEVVPAQERVDADEELHSEFAAFGRIRELMSALPEEEPPPAISAKLLHAAAQQAAASPAAAHAASNDDESSGIWAWVTALFRPLVLYPGLAAATSLVLVAGVAGALYVSGRVAPEQSAVMSAEPSLQQAKQESTKAGQAQQADEFEDSAGAAASEASLEPADNADGEAPEATGEAVESRPGDLPGRPAESGKKALESRRRARIDVNDDDLGTVEGAFKSDLGGRGGDGAKAPAKKARSKNRSKRSRSSSRPANRADSKAVLDIDLEKPVLMPVPKSPPPEPEADAADESEASERQAADDKREERPRRTRGASKKKDAAPASSSQVRSLHDEARDAARSGDCSSVRSIGQRILKLDSQYYQERFRRDKALTRCFGKS